MISFETFCQKLSSWDWFLSLATTFVPRLEMMNFMSTDTNHIPCDNEVITSCSHFSCRLPGLSIWHLLECQMLEWHIPIKKNKWLVYKLYHFRSLFSFFHSPFIYRIFSLFYSTIHNLVNLCAALLYKIFIVFCSMFLTLLLIKMVKSIHSDTLSVFNKILILQGEISIKIIIYQVHQGM